MRVPLWLMPFAVLLLAGCSSADPERPPAWWVDRTRAVGLDFVQASGAVGKRWMPEIMGGGAALFDADGDGDLDVFLTSGAPNLGRGSINLGRGAGGGRFYRQGADGTLVDATAASGLGNPGYGMGVAVGDVDNDGDLDLFVTSYGPDRLYVNSGDGRFDDLTDRSGIRVDGWSSGAAFCDYDRDGFLDLYVARYLVYDPEHSCTDAAGRPEYCQPTEFEGAPDVLLHNRGDGSFEDVSAATGIGAEADAGLGVVCLDLDLDLRPDFYVANDLDPNRLWLGGTDGRFRDAAPMLGAAYNLGGAAESGMGIVAADLDGDLDVDLFVTNLEGQTNTLYRNLGEEAGFVDATALAGLAEDSLPLTGFGTVALDGDLDGDLDLVVANGRVFAGRVREPVSLADPWNRYAEPNRLYRNEGDGRFVPVEASGLDRPLEISRGLASGDVDRDGDLDLLLANVEGPARLLASAAPRAGRWLSVRPSDPARGADAIGATVTVTAGARRQVRHVARDGSYLSSSDADAHFGLGDAAPPVEVRVRWADGAVERFEAADVDRRIVVVRGAGDAVGAP